MAEENKTDYGNAIIGSSILLCLAIVVAAIILNSIGNSWRYQPVVGRSSSGRDQIYAFDTWTGNCYYSLREAYLPINKPKLKR